MSAGILACRNNEIGCAFHILHIRCLHRSVAAVEHEVHIIVLRIDCVVERVPRLAVEFGGGRYSVAWPALCCGVVRSVATPRPHIHRRPSHGVGVDVNADVVRLERLHLISPGDGAQHLSAREQRHLQRGVSLRQAQRGAVVCACALAGGVCSVERVNQLCVFVCGDGPERHRRPLIIVARRQRSPCRLHGALQEVTVVVPFGCERPCVGVGRVGVGRRSHSHMQSSLRSRSGEYVSCHATAVAFPCALVVDAREVTQQNHVLDVGLAVDPMLEKHTGRTRHGEDVGVSRQRVALDRVLLLRG